MEALNNTPIVFLCSIPLIASAIRFAGDGGARITLDIPESDVDAVKDILNLRGGVLIGTLQRQPQTPLVEESRTIGRPNPQRRTAKRPTDLVGG